MQMSDSSAVRWLLLDLDDTLWTPRADAGALEQAAGIDEPR
jgi:hypothetical protein